MGWWKRDKGGDPKHLQTGRWGEAVAEKALKQKGFEMLGRRVRVGVRDEIDLIARDRDCLVFVEVKTRKSETFGRPIESVNRAKRHTLSRAAIRYMMRLREKPDYFRFDVVEVVGQDTDAHPVIRHIENAFTLDRAYKVPW
ncbi:MAG: YraN family protein [Lentisphaerota bacterium]